MWTFQKAFNRLTEAYIKDLVNPYDQCACFVGNLLNGREWTADESSGEIIRNYQNEFGYCVPLGFLREDLVTAIIQEEVCGYYTPGDIDRLEKLFLKTYQQLGGRRASFTAYGADEEALFKAFEATLDLLREIHENKGEVIEPFQFQKRQLQH